ncbi:MAG: hypothetical protein KDD42_02925 [Bdellovibrionales bacterium]|nr:hypothetical protein [Bdellovibrionales bacterium]
MLVVIASQDHFLSNNLSRLVEDAGLRKIRTVKVDRVLKEMKQPERFLIIDAKWDEIKKGGLLRQLVNIGRISGNRTVVICPNDDEKLKKQARGARPDEVFIRYDLELGFKDLLEEVAKEVRA